MKLVRSLPEMCASRVWPLGVSFPVAFLAHDAFDLDNVFFRQANCLLMDLLSLSCTDGRQ